MKPNAEIKNRLMIPTVVAAVLFLLTYWPTLVWMWDRWFARDSYYSHGPLIPLVAGFLIWQKRKELAFLPNTPSPWGMWLFILGIVIHVVSTLFRVYFTSGFSMILVLIGFVLSIYGRQVLRAVVFPLCFLAFMVPLPMVAIVYISFQLKILATRLAVIILHQTGVAAIEEGSYIRMRHAFVVVEDVCSGLRSLISLLALGALAASWVKSGPVKRIILFASAVPIAIMTNAIRIALLAMVSEFWGPAATQMVHDLSGFFVFGLAFLLLYSVGKILE